MHKKSKCGKGRKLQPATATAALLPGGVGGDGGAVLDPADLHASSGKGAEGGLGPGSGSLGPVSTSGTQLDMQGGNAKGLHTKDKIYKVDTYRLR